MRISPPLLLAVALASGGLYSCFAPEAPACSFSCAEGTAMNGRRCPGNYECRDDGYCHKAGDTSVCPFTMPDMTAAAPRDLAVTLDLAPGGDLAVSRDLASSGDMEIGCADGIRNGAETDVDCGGASGDGGGFCAPCDTGKVCIVNRDCQSGICAAVDMGQRCAPRPFDMSSPGDLATPQDLATPRDLATPQDLATPRDLATPPDLVAPRDLATPRG